MKNIFITTPIYYINDEPHIGSSYTTLNADVLSRYFRQKYGNDKTFFLTGTDEHGLKIKQSADEKNITPQELTDKVSSEFKSTWKKLNISNDYFIRTTDTNHKKIVSDLLNKIKENGFIYEDVYEGLYCVGCEKFLMEDDLVDGKCPLHPNKELTQYKEKNWFFKLSVFQKQLIEIIEKDEYKIYPVHKKNEVLSKLKKGLTDISISRNGLDWGIPVPWDNSQTIYVWVDALINYYSALKINKKEDFWPAFAHLVGKDILWFHGIIWPALLLAANLPHPKNLLCHGFFTINGQKMSKSLGNVIRPIELVERYGLDAARFLILSATQFGEDGDVSIEKFDVAFNAKLANGIGNLISRVARLSSNENFSFPILENNKKDEEFEKYLESFEIDKALLYMFEKFEKLNNILDTKKPWELIKNNNLQDSHKCLSELVYEIRNNIDYLYPFMPEFSEKVKEHFNKEKIEAITPLFPRIK